MEVSLNEIARAPICMGSEPQFPCQWLLGITILRYYTRKILNILFLYSSLFSSSLYIYFANIVISLYTLAILRSRGYTRLSSTYLTYLDV